MALHIVSTNGPDEAICGVTLEPYVVVRREGTNTTCTAEDVPEEKAGDTSNRFCLRFRWYRSVLNRGGATCWIHGDREATIQCVLCLRSKVENRKTYHCSTDCLRQHWSLHKELHSQGRSNGHTANGYAADVSLKGGNTFSNGGETWVEIAKGRVYTPCAEDVGSILKCEVVSLDNSSPFGEVGRTHSLQTTRVKPTPEPPKRDLLPLPAPAPGATTGAKFTVLTYNILADLYATTEAFPYCQPWVLSWAYRRQNLLREITALDADILCLQEVQSNHYQDFWNPELTALGYHSVYKKKTSEIYTNNSYAIDGCATFFRKTRFALVKKYEVEFNKAALSLSDALGGEHRKNALGRLLKDNVALIAVLEALDPASSGGDAARRQLICVANTHIHANPELNDVKLWQVHTLLKGLEKIAASADIPMLVAGDFNSIPGSAAHCLLVKQAVEQSHPELAEDPLGILRPASKLQHQLPLASAYTALAEARPAGNEAPLLKQKRRLDPRHHEPRFTNLAKDFKGTLDYILYTSDSLAPTAVLELPDEAELKPRPGTGLPNETWSSDHIALLAEFQYCQS